MEECEDLSGLEVSEAVPGKRTLEDYNKWPLSQLDVEFVDLTENFTSDLLLCGWL
jgi:hypothetical protein